MGSEVIRQSCDNACLPNGALCRSLRQTSFLQRPPLRVINLLEKRHNVRSATTLGIVGAGGIGQTLYESIRSFQYAETAEQAIVVVVTVIIIVLVSARIRKAPV